ncbi:Potassium/sodium hyperpolarization-activated cyclic nucleotide-gated channel 4 [Nowakowskiella sp. JEL0078]|nr:Potassium/sodium hyperpolarization-activated cyclic nucleotide-gated channel 4 [Nowakowskiella sp. JEL0078]
MSSNDDRIILKIAQRLRKIEDIIDKQEDFICSLKDDVKSILQDVSKIQKNVLSVAGNSNGLLASSISLTKNNDDQDKRQTNIFQRFGNFDGIARRGSVYPGSYQSHAKSIKSVDISNNGSHLALEIHNFPIQGRGDLMELKIKPSEANIPIIAGDYISSIEEDHLSRISHTPRNKKQPESVPKGDIPENLFTDTWLSQEEIDDVPPLPVSTATHRISYSHVENEKTIRQEVLIEEEDLESQKNINTAAQSNLPRLSAATQKNEKSTPQQIQNTIITPEHRRSSYIKSISKKMKHIFVVDQTVAPWAQSEDSLNDITASTEDLNPEFDQEKRASEDVSYRTSAVLSDLELFKSPGINDTSDMKVLDEAIPELERFRRKINRPWNAMFRGKFYEKEAHKKLQRIGLEAVNKNKFNFTKFMKIILLLDFSIHPNSTFRHVWNTIQNLAHFILFLALPVLVCYKETMSYIYAFSIAMSTVFFMSILIAMHTGYYRDGILIMNPAKIMRRYYNGWFIFDVITAMPFVFIVDSIVGSDETMRYQHRFICLLSGLRIIKLLMQKRPSWFESAFKKLHRTLGVNFYFLATLKVLGTMAVYWHWSACIMNWVNTITGDNEALSLEDDNAFHIYTIGFYNSAAEMLAAGFGAIEPKTFMKRWITVLNMIMSAVLLAFLVGNVSAFMIGLDASGRLFKEKIDEVNQAIALHNCRALILRVPFFEQCDNVFISAIVSILEPVYFLDGDTIIEEGTCGDEMYFISSGIVEVLINGNQLAKLTTGMFFGEIALLFGLLKRTATIKAVTPCLLYSLSKSNLDRVIDRHPGVADQFKLVAEERLKRMNKTE